MSGATGSLTKDGCHISLVFREMWDSTALSLWLLIHPMHLAVNIGGIPYLAKNERDMGHPSFARERELSHPARLCRLTATLLRKFHVVEEFVVV
jgi:hypothetical protein